MKIAIIGCGAIADAHLRVLKKLKRISQTIVYDIDYTKSEALANCYGVQRICRTIDELFNAERPEAAHILTPPMLHAELAEQALQSGSHVLLEKPATRTVAELNRLLELSGRMGKMLTVDYSLLGITVVRKAIREIASGKFGRLISAHCNFACSWPGNTIPYGSSTHWAYALRGGVLQNMADHPASLILAVLQPIEEFKILFVRRNLLPNNCPDLLQVAIRNQDQIGSFTLSLAHGNAERRAYFLLEGGTIMIDLGRQVYFSTKGKGPQNFVKKTLSGLLEGQALMFGTFRNVFQVLTGQLQRDPGIVNIIQNFYQAIRGEVELFITPTTATAVTGLLENIWNEIVKDDSKTDRRAKSRRVNQKIQHRL